MTASAMASPRFVRRTRLAPNEYRRNFRQIDRDVIAAVTSREADQVTPLMSKIYLRLVDAPAAYWEGDGVLRFEGKQRDQAHVTAWEALCEVVGVASATARKALRWMHEQGIIGYFAGKNGVGIRVFLNRASSSIGTRQGGQKILEFRRASSGGAGASRDEAAFRDSYADLEDLETDINPRAPKSGAGQGRVVEKQHDPCAPSVSSGATGANVCEGTRPPTAPRVGVPVEELVSRLRRELELPLRSAAREAAAQEHERTREWLESKGLPKAARVAQREAYNVLRRHGLFSGSARGGDAVQGGEGVEVLREEAKGLTDEEAGELAETCVALLEAQGQGIDETLSGLSAERGGPLRVEEVKRVRELALTLAGRGRRE